MPLKAAVISELFLQGVYGSEEHVDTWEKRDADNQCNPSGD
jgi:hypothetical protein